MTDIKFTAYSRDGDVIKNHEWDGSNRLVLGKSSSCNFTIKNKYISRQHGLLIERNGSLIYFDLNSLNGTYIDGERIEHAKLESGDKFRVGPITIEVEKISDSGSGIHESGVSSKSDNSEHAKRKSSDTDSNNGSPESSPGKSELQKGSGDEQPAESSIRQDSDAQGKNKEDSRASSSIFIPFLSVLILLIFGVCTVLIISLGGTKKKRAKDGNNSGNVMNSKNSSGNSTDIKQKTGNPDSNGSEKKKPVTKSHLRHLPPGTVQT